MTLELQYSFVPLWCNSSSREDTHIAHWRAWIQFAALTAVAVFHLHLLQEAAGDGSITWVLPIHVGDTEGSGPGFSLL